ncbi:MAG: hypothetical protein RL693_1292, partial [Verrucomicrobiota bacterium]
MPHPSSLILHPLRSLPAFIAVLGIMMPPLPVRAGDILRGGARPNAARPGAVASEAAAVAAQQARSNAKDALSRTTQAMSAVRAMQAAARSLSLGGPNNLGPDPNHPGLMLPNVPDGLTPGGLQIAGAPVGAGLPSQASVGGRAVVNIQQTAQQALLNWTTFNVGKNTTVKFDQSAGGADVGKWIAFNKVSDPSGSPSQILGSIEAPGQVYVINQNGIIFGGSSQVNTHILVASSLPINDNLIDRGLLNNPDAQFLFSALPLPAGSKGPTPAFTPPTPLTPSGRSGDVTVQAGAQLTAPTTAANVGGRVVLVGPNVTNAGTISTPDGQTILAAGLQVGFDAHKSSDPSLRGLDVYVGAVDQYRLSSNFITGDTSITVANTAGLEVGAKVTGAGIPAGSTIQSITDATHYVISAPPTADGSNTPLDHSLTLYAGTATNSGFIDAPRANVTIAGKTVNQLGAIRSSTSVSLNGRIDLLASYNAISNIAYDAVARPDLAPFLNRSTGLVKLGAGSVMEMLPEYSSADKVIGTELALKSEVRIVGKAVNFEPNALLLAPNAKVNVSAGVWDYTVSASNSTNPFVFAGGQIYLGRDAMINVAGSTDVSVPLSQHILTVELRGAEVADSPLQRDSVFRRAGAANPKITVDLRKTGTYNGLKWVGTPLANLTGYLNLIERTVGELTTAGGSVSLNAGGSVVIQGGATVDVSGGFINYEGGTVKTTRVMHMGRLFEIADALPDRVYDGIYTGIFTENHARWGVTKNYTVPWMTGEHYEQPYLQGANGGSLAIGAGGMALDGTLLGQTISGPRQRSEPPGLAELSLSFQSQLVQQPNYPFVSATPPEVVFTENTSQSPVGAFGLDANGDPLALPADRLARVLLSPSIFTTQGFGKLTVVNPDGNISVPKQIALQAPPLGAVVLKGANVNVQGSITAPGGTVILTAYNISPSVAEALSFDPAPVTPPANLNRGLVSLGSSASLNTAGLIVDDRLSAAAPLSLPLVTTGGSVSVTAFAADLSPGSAIDVSGGVAVSAFGQRTYGNGGSISIKTGQDPTLSSVIGGNLKLGSELRGYSGAIGGSLSIQAMLIQIGGRALHEDTLLLNPDFFRRGGFTSYGLTGIGGLTDDNGEAIPSVFVAPGTEINPVAESYIARFNVPGSDDAILTTVLKPEGLRSPVSVSLNAPTLRDKFDSTILLSRGDIVFSPGAVLKTDPLGSVSLVGGTVSVFGSIIAPGGSITVQGANTFPSSDVNPLNAFATVYLAPGSLLSAAGTTVLTPDRFGHRTGTVLPGGRISVSGNIVAAAGATLDVSGTTDVLDIAPAYLGLNAYMNGPLAIPMVPVTSGLTSPLYPSLVVPTRVDSNGGSISLKGGQALFVDALLLGDAGGPTALGGSLSISSG